MYKLEGEDQLIFSILTTMDGNDSLKWVLRHEKTSLEQDEADEPTLAKSKEGVDNRDAGDGYFISREKVDKWAKSRLGEQLPMQPRAVVSSLSPNIDDAAEHDLGRR
jgi:hypothetical protein